MRRACSRCGAEAWQEWAAALLRAHGLQPAHGELGDEVARRILGSLVGAGVQLGRSLALEWGKGER